MNDKTLVILAAGMGSRFGGIKQLEPVDNYGNYLIDYSIYDAIKAGFNKIIFVIKREHEDIFKETIGKRISKKVKVCYAYQENDNLKKYINEYVNREKPFGTAHALYCAKEYIDGPFGLISADDFYGRDAFVKLYESLENKDFCTIGYKIINTMSKYGGVKRGVCFIVDGYLTKNDDYVVKYENGELVATSLVNNETIKLDIDTYASMLMYSFDKRIIDYIEDNFKTFFDKNKENMEKCEYLIPMVLTHMITENQCRVKLVKTDSTWMGMTYKEDLETVRTYLSKLVKDKVYPNDLWGNDEE